MSRISPLPHLALGLLLAACFADPSTGNSGSDSDSDTTGNGDGDGDGDGDGNPGDGDGNPGDGDGNPGDGDGEPCVGIDCPCSDPTDCLPEHMCIDDICTDAWCGDGEVNNQEPCDDGNDIDGDGCDIDCTYTEIMAIGAGTAHNCVLLEGGRIRCWGLNLRGELGVGNIEWIGDDEPPSAGEDVPLPGPALQLSVGDQHACALLANEQVHCWGVNTEGRLGYANTNDIGDDEFPTEAVDVGGPVDEIQAGGLHSCAVLNNGSVRCWGLGTLGRLGYANTTTIGDNETPASVGDVMVGGPSVAVSVGGAHTCALALTGTIRCWGRNEQGQLGYGNTNSIGDNETPSSAGNVSAIPMGLPLNTKIVRVSHGVAHTCALYETGDVLCWGDAVFGELGTGATMNIGDNELPSTRAPVDLPGPAIDVSAGGGHSCALLEGGDIYCWGANTFGELGYGNTSAVGDDESPSTAGPVSVGAPARLIDAGFFHTCAVTNTNEVRCWGNNDGGQLGLGHTNKIGDDEIPNSVPPIDLF